MVEGRFGEAPVRLSATKCVCPRHCLKWRATWYGLFGFQDAVFKARQGSICCKGFAAN